MNSDELKRRLGQILAEEEGPGTDWNAVAALSAQLVADYGPELPSIAKSYLASEELRRADAVFAHAQRSQLVEYLQTGD